MNYNIISSGSCGNCIILENEIALDMGVSFKDLTPYYKNLKMVFISHIHSDHLKKSTIKRLAFERPTLLYVVGSFLVDTLIKCGVKASNIIVANCDSILSIKINDLNLKVKSYSLKHDVPNYGFEIDINNKKVAYCTDTKDLDGISIKNADLYFIEGNYEEEEMRERIARKIEAGEFVNEYRTKETHQSKEKATEWLLANMSENSEFVFIHEHKEREA